MTTVRLTRLAVTSINYYNKPVDCDAAGGHTVAKQFPCGMLHVDPLLWPLMSWCRYQFNWLLEFWWHVECLSIVDWFSSTLSLRFRCKNSHEFNPFDSLQFAPQDPDSRITIPRTEISQFFKGPSHPRRVSIESSIFGRRLLQLRSRMDHRENFVMIQYLRFQLVQYDNMCTKCPGIALEFLRFSL